MKILKNIIKNLGLDNEEELASFKPIESLPVVNNTNNDYTKRLITVRPKSFRDIESVVDALLLGECSIIDMGNISQKDSVRIIDFLSGAIYSQRAELKRLQGDLYLVIPSNIELNKLG